MKAKRAKAVKLLLSENEHFIDPITRVVRHIPQLACELLRDLLRVLESQQANHSQGMKKGELLSKIRS